MTAASKKNTDKKEELRVWIVTNRLIDLKAHYVMPSYVHTPGCRIVIWIMQALFELPASDSWTLMPIRTKWITPWMIQSSEFGFGPKFQVWSLSFAFISSEIASKLATYNRESSVSIRKFTEGLRSFPIRFCDQSGHICKQKRPRKLICYLWNNINRLSIIDHPSGHNLGAGLPMLCKRRSTASSTAYKK